MKNISSIDEMTLDEMITKNITEDKVRVVASVKILTYTLSIALYRCKQDDKPGYVTE